MKNNAKHSKPVTMEFERVNKELEKLRRLIEENSIQRVKEIPSVNSMKEGILYVSENKISIKVNGIEKIFTTT